MKTILKWVKAKLTKKNAKWLLKTTVLSWLVQGALYGVLLVCGLDHLQSLITAKASAWLVWLVQCVTAARG
jgi:hypothetical protein